MRQLNSRVLENEKVGPKYYRMRIESRHLARYIKPGQFIEARCSDEFKPLLRRPFSVHRILKDGIEILYEVVGKGTEILSRKKRGDYLDIIGPLGNGFDLNAIRYPLSAILIAGGMGVAPLVALAEALGEKLTSWPVSRLASLKVIIGVKTKKDILCEKEFKKLGAEVRVVAEDGSKGRKGLATDLLKSELANWPTDKPATIYACGPNAMLKEVARIAKTKRIPCQVSLEEYMACGVGVCLGCPVKVKTNDERRTTKYEYKMVCKDGPIFDAEDIEW